MAIATQFCFDSDAIIHGQIVSKMNIDIPIHIGIAGPAKLNFN